LVFDPRKEVKNELAEASITRACAVPNWATKENILHPGKVLLG